MCVCVCVCVCAHESVYVCTYAVCLFAVGQVAYLEQLRSHRLHVASVLLQCHIRGWVQRHRYQRLKRAAVSLQAIIRGVLARRCVYVQVLIMIMSLLTSLLQTHSGNQRNSCSYTHTNTVSDASRSGTVSSSPSGHTSATVSSQRAACTQGSYRAA